MTSGAIQRTVPVPVPESCGQAGLTGVEWGGSTSEGACDVRGGGEAGGPVNLSGGRMASDGVRINI